MSYDSYACDGRAWLPGEAGRAVDSIDKFAPGHRDRLFVVISEFNSRDYMLDFENAGWSSDNNLGHALANMDMCGQIALDERIKYAMIWNTRWMRQSNQHEDIFYGFDANNGLMPSTMCLYIWGRFMREEVLEAEFSGGLSVFAYKNDGGLSVFVINKKGLEKVVTLTAAVNDAGEKSAQVFTFTGTDPSDLYPVFRQSGDYTRGSQYNLPPYSLTVFDFNK